MSLHRLTVFTKVDIIMKFTKMHGCGNDYIYVDCFKETVKNPSAVAVKLSDRHFGVGSDGLILIKRVRLPILKWKCIMQTAVAAQCAATA